MRLLLDTHIAIWAMSRPHHLPKHIEAMLEDPANEIFVSAAGIWELAIKSSLKRATAPEIDPNLFVRRINDAGYAVLPVDAHHGLAVMHLPHLHGDPFDRIMIAQAKSEPMRLITHDRMVAAYDENIVTW